MILRALFIILWICNACFAKSNIYLNAPYSIVMDHETREILFENNSLEKMNPSSMSKLALLYVAFEQLSLNIMSLEDVIQVSENASKQSGSKMFLRSGQKVSIEDLIRGIIIQSGNDAAVALSEGLFGSEEKALRIINGDVFMRLGMRNSHLSNVTGMPNDDHYMTARDILLLSCAVVEKFPQYYHYFSEKEFIFNNIKQNNYNESLWIGSEFDGLKTGRTDKGGYGVSASAVKDGRRLIGVVNGLSGSSMRKNEVKKLFNYGFNNFKNVVIFKKGEVIDEIKISHGFEIELIAKEDIIKTISNNNVENPQDWHAIVKYKKYLRLPIKKDDAVAILEIYDGNNKKSEHALYSKMSIINIPMYKKILNILKFY